MKEYDYAYKSSKVIEMHFYFDNLDKNANHVELLINAVPNVSRSLNNEEQYLLEIKFTISENKTKKVILFINIANEFILKANPSLTGADIDKIISTEVTIDCLEKCRDIIKNVSMAMGIEPMEIPKFDIENK